MAPRIPSPVPHGRTAVRRLEWVHLPPAVRALVERRCGSPVVHAVSQGGGFTPGLAAVLECADGSRHFVKAASVRAQRQIAASYREEARRLANLPSLVPAPRLRWSHVDDDWVVLGIEHVDGRAPQRPWLVSELDRCLDALEQIADVATPPPAAMQHDDLTDLAAELADWPACWDRAAPARADLDARRLAEAAGLAAGFAGVLSGSTLVHLDVRDDNLLLCGDGRTLLCDWNWPVAGAAWIDSVTLLATAYGDGLAADRMLASRSLTRDVPAEDIDVLLALLAGYFLDHGAAPVPRTSPWLRAHQQHSGEVCWSWLAARRGWDDADITARP